MQVCTVASGNTALTLSGRPFSPSQTTKNTSLTPRVFRSVRTANQNFADSPSPSPAPKGFRVKHVCCLRRGSVHAHVGQVGRYVKPSDQSRHCLTSSSVRVAPQFSS